MTLKQIIARLQTLAESHRQINTFYYGSFDEFIDGQDIIYPAIFCELNDTANVSLTNRITNYQFNFYFFDLLDTANRSLNNQLEVQSDMASIAQDYLAMLYDITFKDWEIGEEYNMTIRDYELQDLTCGVSIQVNIGTRFDANLCQVPIEVGEVGNFVLVNNTELLLIDNTNKLEYA